MFISYARKDGRDLTVRLHDDLTTAGYSAWLDSSEIAGGASWSHAIEQAIERCDVALALLSAESFGSDICRAEQLRALRKDKRAIPSLAHLVRQLTAVGQALGHLVDRYDTSEPPSSPSAFPNRPFRSPRPPEPLRL